ncbi:MAG TPA: hypothetical protein VGI40_00990 [Pirellulaceae bacterium]|jgi:hypothetical protein
MLTILADHNVEAHLDALVNIWTSAEWLELWQMVDCKVCKFASVGLRSTTPDSELWSFCQTNQMLLLTGNRNADGPDSLEMTSLQRNTALSLPVLTFGDPDRVLRDRLYAEAAASRILDYVVSIKNFRGARRLYVP